MEKKNPPVIPLLVSVFLLGSCASVRTDMGPGPGRYIGPDRAPTVDTKPNSNPTRVQEQLRQRAYDLVGRRSLVVNNREFRVDCTGTVAAAYWGAAGIDLYGLLSGYSGNGVDALYRALEDRGLAGPHLAPEPGDLVFWDDTWDANGNGRWDDPLTHVGIVVETYPDGRVEFVHEHVDLGIVVQSMNLREPDTWKKDIRGTTKEINAPMRINSNSGMDRWLASHLFRGYGKAYLLGR